MTDLTGERFGLLTVLGPAGRAPHRGMMWKCICDCGTERVVSGYSLRKGESRSCGCLRKVGSDLDLTGQRFGKLVVIGLDEKKTSRKGKYWKCECDCGNTISTATYNLRNGRVQSCGCVQTRKVLNEVENFESRHDCECCADKRECIKEFCKYERDF